MRLNQHSVGERNISYLRLSSQIDGPRGSASSKLRHSGSCNVWLWKTLQYSYGIDWYYSWFSLLPSSGHYIYLREKHVGTQRHTYGIAAKHLMVELGLMPNSGCLSQVT